MIKGRLKTSEWEAAVKKLHSVGKKKLAKVMEQSAKLVMRDIIAFTPPFGNAPVTEAFKKKKDLGMAAVKSDILKIYSNFKNIGPVKSNNKLGKRIKLLAKTDSPACRDLLNTVGYKCHAVTVGLNTHYHKKARNNRGRVKWSESKGKVYVVNFTEVNKYIKAQQKKVGTGMSGWAWGVKKLKVSRIPKWATDKRSKSRGRARLISKKFPDWSLIVSNQVKHTQHISNSVRPVQRALKNQIRNLKKRTEEAIKHAARKSGF